MASAWQTFGRVRESSVVVDVIEVNGFSLQIYVGISDLVLIGIHVRPHVSDTQTEINALVSVYEEAVRIYNTTNVIIMGDMNADCSYLSNSRYSSLTFTTDNRFLWLIGKENDTTVTNSTCAYDR